MTKTMWGYAVAVAMTALAATGCDKAQASGSNNDAVIKRGEYLVTVGGCNDCHTPIKMGPNGPEPDMSRMLSGHPEQLEITQAPAPAAGTAPWMVNIAATGTAYAGPWGVSFTANLTPDNNTGIGIWTEDIFVKTLRTGKHWGTSRRILPPMPWFNYAKMTDDDLKAVYAYLRTIKPITNHVPEPLPPAATPTVTEH
jgi:mono/diheme cytochrome c family protein